MDKKEFMRQWGISGMPADKIRLANAAWDDACAWQREQDCKIIDSIDDGDAPEYRACQEAIREAANVKLRGE